MGFFTSAAVLRYGASLTFWKATAGTTPAGMLMCDKVTHKKLIDSRSQIPSCLCYQSCYQNGLCGLRL